MTDTKQQVPDWLPERFFNNIKDELENKGSYILEWSISKTSLIATLNYIRAKGYKCEWIEKGEQLYDIKISINKPQHSPGSPYPLPGV